ncbi:MFS transporter [Faucicola atlantae]|nr:MFS transporter [Moraxella atlantae]
MPETNLNHQLTTAKDSDQPTLPTLSPVQQKFLPVVVAIALFMQILDATVLNTALPAMARDLNQPALSMQWAVISYALTLAIFTPISGFIADKYGTRTTFLVAISVFSVGSLMCAISPTLGSLIFARVVQGLGGALLMPVARLTLIKSYPREQMLSVMNYAVMPALVAPVVGPLVGGYLVEWASWHWIF